MSRPRCFACESDAQPGPPGHTALVAFVSAAAMFAWNPSAIVQQFAGLCDPHRDYAARALTAMAAKNGIPIAVLLEKLSAGLPIPIAAPVAG
jgi:hypothetical protein